MTFSESISTCLRQKYLFSFRGRASRSEFWWFALFVILIDIAYALVSSLFPEMLAALLGFAISVLLFPPQLGVTVRRFHDRNLSGWWLLLPIALLISLFFGVQNAITFGMMSNLLSLAVSVAYLIVLCLPSQPDANKYGPPPLNSL